MQAIAFFVSREIELKKCTFLWASAFMGLAISASANAAVITSESAIRVTDMNGVLQDQLLDQNSGSGVVSSSLSGLQGNSQASANDAAYLFTIAELEAAGGSILTTVKSRVEWTTSYIASTSGDYFWNFSLPAGMLSVEGSNSSGGWAGYDILISGGGSSWHSSANLLHDTRSTYAYSTAGQSLGGSVTGSGRWNDPFAIVFDAYADSLGLGYFNSGDTIQISYSMFAEAGGPGYEVRANAVIGDPAYLAGGAGGVLTSRPSNAVSEPSSLLLAGLGLLSALVHRRRSSNQQPARIFDRA